MTCSTGYCHCAVKDAEIERLTGQLAEEQRHREAYWDLLHVIEEAVEYDGSATLNDIPEHITALRYKLADVEQANRVLRDEFRQMEARAKAAEDLVQALISERTLAYSGSWEDFEAAETRVDGLLAARERLNK